MRSRSRLCNCCPTRSAIGSILIKASLVLVALPGLVADTLPYMGRKPQADTVRPASPARPIPNADRRDRTVVSRRDRPVSTTRLYDDIDHPVGDDNHFFRGFAVQGALHPGIGQSRRFRGQLIQI